MQSLHWLNPNDTQRGLTPLHIAARHGDSLLVMGLLARGAIADALSKV